MTPLIETINTHHSAVKDSLDRYIPLLTEARKANDPLSASVQLLEVLRHLTTVSKTYADALKTGITEQMIHDGEYKADCGPYVVTLRQGSTRAVVTDADDLRRVAPDLFQSQPDKVNTKDLARLLSFQPIAGAEIVEGAPTIMVKGKET